MAHPHLHMPRGTIRQIMNRTRHLRDARPVPTAPPQALPAQEIPEWGVERGRQELDTLLDRARRNQQG